MSKSRILVFLVASVALSSVAAADGYEPVGKGFAPPPVPSWTGFYVGLQAGYAWDNDSDVPWGDLGGPLDENDGPFIYDSFVGGVHAGYTIQSGKIVWGIEGDLEYAPGEGDDEERGGDINGLDTNFTASIRGRLGLVSGRSLIYLTGGYAYLDADAVVRDDPAQPEISTSFHGWTLGGGWEYAWHNSLTFRAEYRYTDFDLTVENYNIAGYRLGFEPELHAVRAAVSKRF